MNDKLLWYFIWSKYFKQNTEITEIIIYLGGKKKKLVHSFQIFPKTNHTSADSRNCVSHRQNINCYALNWLKVFKNCFETARQAVIQQKTPVFSWSMNHIYLNFSKPSLSTEKRNISIGIFFHQWKHTIEMPAKAQSLIQCFRNTLIITSCSHYLQVFSRMTHWMSKGRLYWQSCVSLVPSNPDQLRKANVHISQSVWHPV